MVKKKINKRISKYLIKKKNYLNNSCDNNIKSNEVSCISIRKKLKLKNKSTFKIIIQAKLKILKKIIFSKEIIFMF
jgi:hypothetical protein